MMIRQPLTFLDGVYHMMVSLWVSFHENTIVQQTILNEHCSLRTMFVII
ncbi:hypothetical protein BACI348_40998 [Bacillus altitudinis]|uniref:Uncharacterized protein n=1 Tax=Bacillus altitudinis TaxID=293387 RepID=A0A653RIU8_BACAB|nr:hypothetical protein BACI348_40998 [Bacillus altitudinis]